MIKNIVLSNPAKRNALTRESLDHLVHELTHLHHEVRCVVLHGDPAGGAFSAGFDITHIDDGERDAGLDPIRVPADTIEKCHVPVIAAIEGACMGGALELAMACTLRVASTSSKLAMPPAKLGLVYSHTGLERFLRAVRPSTAQRLFLTGERITAGDALAVGLVDVVTDEGRAVDEAGKIAHTIAANAPLAVRGLLDAIRRLSRPGGATDADRAAIDAARERTVASSDLAEGVRAFAEKRPPKFEGR